MYNASLYAALLLGYTIHFIYCIWGNLSFIAKAPLQGNSNGMMRAIPPCLLCRYLQRELWPDT